MILQTLSPPVCQHNHEKHHRPRSLFPPSSLPSQDAFSHRGTTLNGYDVMAWQDASGRTRIWTQVARGLIQDKFSFYLKWAASFPRAETQSLWGPLYNLRLCQNDDGTDWKVIPPGQNSLWRYCMGSWKITLAELLISGRILTTIFTWQLGTSSKLGWYFLPILKVGQSFILISIPP